MYALDDGKLLDRNTVKQLQLTAPALPLVFNSLSRKAVQPLCIEQPAVKRSRIVELDDKGNAARPRVTFAYVGLSLENHQPLVYRAGAPWLGSVRTTFGKKRQSSS